MCIGKPVSSSYLLRNGLEGGGSEENEISVFQFYFFCFICLCVSVLTALLKYILYTTKLTLAVYNSIIFNIFTDLCTQFSYSSMLLKLYVIKPGTSGSYL
jgi:hypothetical protein